MNAAQHVTHGRRQATERDWSASARQPMKQHKRRTDVRTKPVASAWMVITFWALVFAALWVLRQPWFLAWRDGP